MFKQYLCLMYRSISKTRVACTKKKMFFNYIKNYMKIMLKNIYLY